MIWTMGSELGTYINNDCFFCSTNSEIAAVICSTTGGGNGRSIYMLT